MVLIVNLNPFSCGFLTWSPRLIFAPAFNHKIGNAAHSGVSKIIVLHEVSQMQYLPKKWTIGRMCFEDLQPCTTSAWLSARSYPKRKITLWCGLTILWLLPVLSLQKFLRWKLKHVFILKSYLSWTIETSFQNNIPMKKTFLHHPPRNTLEQPSAHQLPRLLGKPKHPILAGALTVFNWILSPDSLSK